MKKEIIIHKNTTILEALKKLEQTRLKALICIDDSGRLVGMVVDGDIRRGIISGKSLESPVNEIMNNNPKFLTNNASKHDIQQLISTKIRVLPIVDENNVVIDYHTFKEKHENNYIRNKNISILGMGYVGLTLGLVLSEVGFNIIGYDVNEELIGDLKKKKEPFFEEGLKRYLDKHANTGVRFTTKSEEAGADIYIITVGTPLLPVEKKPNIDHIKKASHSIAKLLKRGDLIILRSTVPTGCSRDIVLPVLEQVSGLKCGEDFYLSFAPERTAEGVALRELRKNPQIIGAFDDVSYDLTLKVFETITHTVINVGSLEAGETCKLIDNTFRDHIFAYANNLARLAEKLGLNIHEIIEAVNFGYERNQIPRPSPGVGGPCLSKDPYILSEVFRANELDSELIMSSRIINELGPKLMKNKLVELLSKAGKNLKTANITLVGMAFKGSPETSDLRDSTSLWFLELITECVNISAYDPVVKNEELEELGVKPVGLDEAFKNADAIVILNNHKSYRSWNLTKLFSTMNSPGVFIDTWNNFKPMDMKQHIGILYGGLGND